MTRIGINPLTGKLKKGYRYTGKRLKNGTPQIKKVMRGGSASMQRTDTAQGMINVFPNQEQKKITQGVNELVRFSKSNPTMTDAERENLFIKVTKKWYDLVGIKPYELTNVSICCFDAADKQKVSLCFVNKLKRTTRHTAKLVEKEHEEGESEEGHEEGEEGHEEGKTWTEKIGNVLSKIFPTDKRLIPPKDLPVLTVIVAGHSDSSKKDLFEVADNMFVVVSTPPMCWGLLEEKIYKEDEHHVLKRKGEVLLQAVTSHEIPCNSCNGTICGDFKMNSGKGLFQIPPTAIVAHSGSKYKIMNKDHEFHGSTLSEDGFGIFVLLPDESAYDLVKRKCFDLTPTTGDEMSTSGSIHTEYSPSNATGSDEMSTSGSSEYSEDDNIRGKLYMYNDKYINNKYIQKKKRKKEFVYSPEVRTFVQQLQNHLTQCIERHNYEMKLSDIQKSINDITTEPVHVGMISLGCSVWNNQSYREVPIAYQFYKLYTLHQKATKRMHEEAAHQKRIAQIKNKRSKQTKKNRSKQTKNNRNKQTKKRGAIKQKKKTQTHAGK